MKFTRRAILIASSTLLACPSFTQEKLKSLLQYEKETGGRIGLYALNLSTGALIQWRAHERFVMCSTFKASLAACVLKRVDQGQSKLEDLISYDSSDLLDYAPIAKFNLDKGALSLRELCKASVELSDNTCANLLLAHIGGPPALTDFWRSLNDKVSRLDHNEPALNRSRPGDFEDTTTPAAMVSNLKNLLFGNTLSDDSRKYLTEWLIGCKTGENRLRAGLPKNWSIGDKTGNNGSDAAGDIAVAWSEQGVPWIISAYTQGGTPTPAKIDMVFKEIGILIKEQL